MSFTKKPKEGEIKFSATRQQISVQRSEAVAADPSTGTSGVGDGPSILGNWASVVASLPQVGRAASLKQDAPTKRESTRKAVTQFTDHWASIP